MSAADAAAGVVGTASPYRVMIVDDSAVIRGIVARWLGDDPEIEVISTASNGEIALANLKKLDVEVIILDIEMPVMDGLTALPLLIKQTPGIRVIMASTLTRRNADITMRALHAGAVDYMAKPESAVRGGASDLYHRELVEKVKIHGATLRSRSPGTDKGTPTKAPAAKKFASQPKPSTGLYGSKPIQLRAKAPVIPRVLGIGSSTGGPQALLDLFGTLRNTIKIPVVITQHMPPTFTRILSEHITKATDWSCTEAKDGDLLKPNHAYMAPGDFHMEVVATPAGPCLKMNQNPPENFCRPSVDPMLRSLPKVFGARVLTAILTGMGNDGLKGGKEVIDAGGTIIAQDEATSVVWGMPGAVATAGVCSAVLPLAKLGGHIMRHIGRGG